jgi:predicted N-acetyltransferase YhbS
VEVKRLQRALELVFAGGIFGKSQIEALEVYKYPMELVARYELKRNGEIPHQLQVTLRQERESDYDDVYKLITAAFGNKIEGDYGTTADYMNAVRNKSTFIPELSLVAENDRGEIVGQITLYETNITTESDNVTELVLSPISVRPELFGRGIARQMVETALSKAKDMGYRAVFLCGKPDLYHRLGFSATYHYEIHHVRDPQAEWSMVRELYENALSGIGGTINTN